MRPNNLRNWCCGGLLATSVFLGTVSHADDEAATTTTNATQLTDDQMGEIFQGAILLARMGLYDEAEQQCNRILAQDPKQPTVRRLLDEIQERKRQEVPSVDLRRKLNDTMIHELNVRDVAVTNVIETLRTESAKVSADKTAINIVWQAPESSKTAKVTLNLHNVPLGEVLNYVTEGAGLRYRADAHAIVIYKPLPTGPKESAPANVKLE
jgi:hypothetical protein